MIFIPTMISRRTLGVIVDMTGATNDPTDAGDSITDSQGNNGWDVDTTGKLFVFSS